MMYNLTYHSFDDIIKDKKKYFIVYADPPYEYDREVTGGSGRSGAAQKYKVMNMTQIQQLPVWQISANPSILFLWVPFPKLPQGLDIIKAWGYQYKTLGFNWLKITTENKIFVGMGNYTRQNSEVCLIGTKGSGISEQRINKDISCEIIARIRDHSVKPDIVRKKIIQLFGHKKSKIELFARRKPPDFEQWDVFGDQIH